MDYHFACRWIEHQEPKRTLALGSDATLCSLFLCDLAKTKFNWSQPGTFDELEDCSNTALRLEDTPD
jgi:hypothetical protein